MTVSGREPPDAGTRFTSNDRLGLNVPDAYFCFSAAFRVKDAGHLHHELAQRLGVEPTSVSARGEPSGALRKPAPHDMWVLDSPLPEEAPLHAHLAWLEQALRPNSEYLKQLIANGIQVDFFCGYRTDSDYSHYLLPAGATAFANEIGAPLHMSYIVA